MLMSWSFFPEIFQHYWIQTVNDLKPRSRRLAPDSTASSQERDPTVSHDSGLPSTSSGSCRLAPWSKMWEDSNCRSRHWSSCLVVKHQTGLCVLEGDPKTKTSEQSKANRAHEKVCLINKWEISILNRIRNKLLWKKKERTFQQHLFDTVRISRQWELYKT
jgi:hypothetical protein